MTNYDAMAEKIYWKITNIKPEGSIVGKQVCDWIAAAKAEAKRMREWWELAIERGELLQKYFDENARLREALEKIVQDKTHACAIAQSALDGGKP